MCVIMASQSTKPSELQMKAGWEQNSWGAGVAWIEKPKKGAPIVRWAKGIETVDEVIALVAKIEPPLVVHFRIPTEGLEDKTLTHPFPVTPTADILFDGKFEGNVLFHNGGWGDWRRFSLDTCLKSQTKLPLGMLNDSRMMAWNAAIYGEGILQLINEKAIVFGPGHFELFGSDKTNGWNFKDGIWFSNDLWERHLPKPKVEAVIRVHDHGGSGGSRHLSSFRTQRQSDHVGTDVQGRNTEQEQVEGREASVFIGPLPSGGGEQKGRHQLAKDVLFRCEMAKIHDTPEQLAAALRWYPSHYNRRIMGFLQEQITH